MPCPTNTSVGTVFFWDLINWVPGLGAKLIRYRTPCPKNTPVWTVYFFEAFLVHWTRGGGGTFFTAIPAGVRLLDITFLFHPQKGAQHASCTAFLACDDTRLTRTFAPSAFTAPVCRIHRVGVYI